MTPDLTKRQKIAHLLRRFGLGASPAELDLLEPMGVNGALEYLLDYEVRDEGFGISPWEICQEYEGGELYVDGTQFAKWWALRLLMSQKPVEQRLTLFWHNHFAVSGEKILFGPMMLAYIETIRRNAGGAFATLLKAVSTDPAMLSYLDGDTNVRNHPNENFARELLELFTLGPGPYKEGDVQEAARAMTGWGNRYMLYESSTGDFQMRLKNCIDRDIPMATSSFSPELFDPGMKDVLGKEAPFNSDQLLGMLAERPETARHITTKMWRTFGCEALPESVSNRLVSVFHRTNGNSIALLRAIAETKEFWEVRCVRQKLKSPVDFIVPILRQLDLQPLLASLQTPGATASTPLPKPLRDMANLTFTALLRQGMALLYPPDVGGWPTGRAWITPNNMLARVSFADTLFGVNQHDHVVAGYAGNRLADTNPITSYNTVVQLLRIFDVDVSPTKCYVLVDAFDRAGGVKSLRNPEAASRSLAAICRVLFGSPEFQLC